MVLEKPDCEADAAGPAEDAAGFPEKALATVLLLVGLGLRLIEYLHYRPLWTDEAVLAAHALKDSTAALFRAMPDIVAPPGYFLLLKACVAVFGVNEYAVRLPSVVGSVGALWLLYRVARRIAGPRSAIIAVAFLAVSEHAVYYAGEVRPYSIDAAMGLLIIFLAWHPVQERLSARALLTFSIVGACAVWLSYPAVFFLAAIAVVQAILFAHRMDWRRLAAAIPAHGLWAVSFLGLYLLTVRSVRDCDTMMRIAYNQYDYAGAFMPFPPATLADVRWFGSRFAMFCEHPLGLVFPGLAGFALIVGGAAIYRKQKASFALLILLVALALIASGLRLYPLHARTMLFLAPIAYLAIGAGVGFVGTQHTGRTAFSAIVLATILLLHPVYRAGRDALEPRSHHELHRILDYVETHWEEGDTLYMRYTTGLAYLFCSYRYEFPEDNVILAPKPADHADDVETLEVRAPQLRGRSRVWIALTYPTAPRAQRFWQAVDTFAVRGQGFHARGASVYLYDFTDGEGAQRPLDTSCSK